MNYIIFDTETTGLSNSDEVIQFAGYVADENCRLREYINFYCYTVAPISPSAFKIHKLNPKKLMTLSQGKTFEDNLHILKRLLQVPDAIWIGYNVDFDIRMINNTLVNNGLDPLDFGKKLSKLDESGYFDIMSGLVNANLVHGSKKLEYVVTSMIGENKINHMFSQVMQSIGQKADAHYHTAEYDAFCTWLLLNKHLDSLR